MIAQALEISPVIDVTLANDDQVDLTEDLLADDLGTLASNIYEWERLRDKNSHGNPDPTDVERAASLFDDIKDRVRNIAVGYLGLTEHVLQQEQELLREYGLQKVILPLAR